MKIRTAQTILKKLFVSLSLMLWCNFISRILWYFGIFGNYRRKLEQGSSEIRRVLMSFYSALFLTQEEENIYDLLSEAQLHKRVWLKFLMHNIPNNCQQCRQKTTKTYATTRCGASENWLTDDKGNSVYLNKSSRWCALNTDNAINLSLETKFH